MSKYPFLVTLVLALTAGCLASKPEPATVWSLDWQAPRGLTHRAEPRVNDAVRLAFVQVAPPCDGARLTVARADGSLAFDAYNVFAAQPAVLAPALVREAVRATGYCPELVLSSSMVQAPYLLEVYVNTLRLEAVDATTCEAVAEVETHLVQGRKVVASGHGTARVPLAAGTLGAVFSRALSEALVKAL